MSRRTTRGDHHSVDFGYRLQTVRTPVVSGRIPLRLVTISALLFALAIGITLVSIQIGDTPLSFGQVMDALLGRSDEFHRRVVVEWRLPVAVAAVTFGALLGIGGAIFQSLTRNPLGSPDIIGFDAGSFTAITVLILVVGTRDYWNLAGAAIAGGIATAVVVYLLAYRGGIQGFRLIIVGIGVSAMLTSINSYLITRADVEEAMVVGFWAAGSIHRVTWSSMIPALIVMFVLVIGTTLLAPSLRRLELGDDAAITQGLRPGPVRLVLIVIGVSTGALVTAAAGPIGFIALAAPQIARRLTRSPGVSVLSAAATGSVLLAGAHLLSLELAQQYRPIPVGLITVSVGGLYLIWLLIREARRRIGPVP